MCWFGDKICRVKLRKEFQIYLTLVALMLIAAFLRYWQLRTLAPEAWFDEVWFALRARELIQHPQFIVFYRTPWGGGNSFMVIMTVLAELLGFDQISASRMVSAFWGVLSVPLAYHAFNEILRASPFGNWQRRWIAVLASGLLATLLHWVIISRVGTEPSLAPAAALFCVWMLKSGQRKPQSWLRFALAGFAAGMAQYNGPHARFVLVLLGILALLDLLRLQGRARLQYFQGLLVGLLAGGLVILPLALFFWREPNWLFARVAQVSEGPLNSLNYLLANVWGILRAFNFYGRFDPLMNYANRPIWDPLQSVGFFVGHYWALRNFRRYPAARELLVWEILMVIPSLLTSDAPNLQRMITSAVGGAGLVAIGWWFSATALLNWAKSRGNWQKSLRWGLGGLVGLSLANLLVTLFVLFPRQPEMDSDYIAAPVRLVYQLFQRVRAGERAFVALYPEADEIISFDYLIPPQKTAETGVERLDLRQCFPVPDSSPTRTSYVFRDKRDPAGIEFLQALYPTAQVTRYDFWQESGALVEVPANLPGPRPALLSNALFAPGLRLVGYEWNGPSVPAGQALFLTLWWKVESASTHDLTRFVHIGTDENTVNAQLDSAPCQGLLPVSRWRTGDLIRDGFALVLPPSLPAGDYWLSLGWYAQPGSPNQPVFSADHPIAGERAHFATLKIAPPLEQP